MEVALVLVSPCYLQTISKLHMGRIDGRIPRLRADRDTRGGSGMHSIDPVPDDYVAYMGANCTWRESEIRDSDVNPGRRRC
jgi:hypothetical protein